MIKISSIEGNRQWLDGGSMFGNAPRAVWEKWTDVDERGRIPLACRCLLIETEQLKILCETGIGDFFEPKLADRFGVQDIGEHKLVSNLNSLGVNPNDIDYVILSHLHFDHAGGLLPSFHDSKGQPDKLMFSNAKIVVGEKAWDRALNPHFRDKASFVPLLNQLLKNSDQLIVVKDNRAPEPLRPFISFFESEGHTPGQMHTVLTGSTGKLIFAGDLIPGCAWIHLPISMGYDRFPEKLIEEKQALYSQYIKDGLKIFFTHDPQFALGTLTQNEKGRFLANDLVESLNRVVL